VHAVDLKLYNVDDIINTNCKPSLLLNNVCLAVMDEVNDRGIVIDSRAFKVYARPILEYASCTWSPHHILKKQQVELYKGNSSSNLLGTRHYGTRRGCRVLVLIAWKCVSCDTICCTITNLYST